MRYASIGAMVILLGLAAGAALGIGRVWLIPWSDETVRLSAGPREAARPTAEKRPRVAVDQVSFDFGSLDVDLGGEHSFRVSNVGQAPLQLSKGTTSCSCVISDLERESLNPGETTSVVLQFKSKGAVGQYHQQATLLTNDPASPRVVLTITGRFTSAVKVAPAELAMGQISTLDTATHEVRLLSFASDAFRVVGHDFSDASTAGSFAVESRPLAPQEISAEKDARGGALLRITVKPGLPLGTFRQTIRVRTNLPKRPVIEIPVEGMVTSDLSIVGAGWNAEQGVLRLGTVPRSEGIRRTLLVIARGPHRKEVKLSAAQITPDLLHVEIGSPSPIGVREVTQTPVTVEIPKDSRPANFTGGEAGPLGEIILQTNHPQVPQIRVRVSFAIEG